MRRIYVNKKTGFKNNTPGIPIFIRDIRGIMFYETLSFSDINKPVKCFNLPPGTYFIESGNFTPLQSPVNYNMVSLPSSQRNYPNPDYFKIVLKNNPNKCSIDWNNKVIIYDKNLFENSSIPVIYFIYGHEKGHRFFRSEKLADLYSGNYMKRIGFNPSQIGMSPITSLSEGQYDRKKLMVSKLNNYA